ncbi:MAG TPA: hypothetical protein PKV86_01235 [Syntrophobacteraceae bacterium]|jgi:ABC-type transporter Mla MlaB component|nr:hypothetical protein [Syntrophobacteraceae bacterium]
MYTNPIAQNIERKIGSLQAFDLPIAGEVILYSDFRKAGVVENRKTGKSRLNTDSVHFTPVKRRSPKKLVGLHRSIIPAEFCPAKTVTQGVRNGLRAMIEWCEANGKDIHEVWDMEVCYESLEKIVQPLGDLLMEKDIYYEVDYLLEDMIFDREFIVLYLPFFDMNYNYSTAYDCILGGIEHFAGYIDQHLDMLREEYTERLEGITVEELKVIDSTGFEKLLEVYREDESEGKVLDFKAVEKWLSEYEEMINGIDEAMTVDIYLLSTESPSMVIEKSEDLDFYVKYFNKFIELEGLLPSAALFDDDYSSGEEFGAIDLMKDIVRVYNESASARKQEDKNDCNG